MPKSYGAIPKHLLDAGFHDSLVQAFRRNIIAEGVDALTHGAALLSLNCFLAQGYGIARPMAAGLFAHWTATWTAEQKWLTLRAAR